MIVESLIQDDSKWTLDCAKATFHKGSKAEVEDSLYWGAEVQGALKMGLIRIIGKIPDPLPEAPAKAEERKVKYRNIYSTKLCFECLRDYADPGCFIHIPESKIQEREIQNAIAWGMIEREDGPKDAVKTRQTIPVKIDEFTAVDATDSEAKAIIDSLPPVEEKPLPPEEKAIAAARSKKTAKKAAEKAEFKPKAISSNSDLDSEDSGSELYSETKVVDPTPKPKKQASPPASVLVEGDEPEEQADEQPATGMPRRAKTFGFMDVFGGAQVSPSKPESKEEDTF